MSWCLFVRPVVIQRFLSCNYLVCSVFKPSSLLHLLLLVRIKSLLPVFQLVSNYSMFSQVNQRDHMYSCTGFNCCTQNHMYTLASLSNHKLLWTSVCGVDYIHLIVGIQLALFPASRTRAREWGYIQLTPCLYYSVLKQNEADMARSKQAQAKQEKTQPSKTAATHMPEIMKTVTARYTCREKQYAAILKNK